jgi:ubiquinone/menaquinone biosynthesis C-methylase UbiE
MENNMLNSKNKYTQMQLNQYDDLANSWSDQNRDPVVGSFDAHNNWPDYELLFRRIKNQSDSVGLDFACGPGRNLVKYGFRFKRLDGVDISSINIEKAKYYVNLSGFEPNLFVSNGVDLSVIEDSSYDFVMSTIALQHICVYDIRYSIMADIYRVLKPGGIFTAQMGFGPKTPYKNSVDYYENYYDADDTNGGCDTRVESSNQLKFDLEKIGFKNFIFEIRPVGPGDGHQNWIFFNVEK